MNQLKQILQIFSDCSKEKKTTAIGTVIILASILSVFTEHTDWSGAVIGIGSGTTLIFHSRDPEKQKDK